MSPTFTTSITNFSQQDKTWSEFSTLEVTEYDRHLTFSLPIWPNLELNNL